MPRPGRGADPARLAQVERRPLDRHDAGRERGAVDREELVGVDRDEMLVDGPGALALEVEVGVAGQVDHRRRVGRGGQLERHHVALHPIGRPDRQPAREALVTVRAHQLQDRPALVARHHVPHPLVEALGSAVQAVAAVVGADPRLATVELEATTGDAVGVAADGAAEVRRAREPVLQAPVTQDHVAPDPVAAGDRQGVQRGAQRPDLEDRARRHAEGEALDRTAVAQGPDLVMGRSARVRHDSRIGAEVLLGGSSGTGPAHRTLREVEPA